MQVMPEDEDHSHMQMSHSWQNAPPPPPEARTTDLPPRDGEDPVRAAARSVYPPSPPPIDIIYIYIYKTPHPFCFLLGCACVFPSMFAGVSGEQGGGKEEAAGGEIFQIG